MKGQKIFDCFMFDGNKAQYNLSEAIASDEVYTLPICIVVPLICALGSKLGRTDELCSQLRF